MDVYSLSDLVEVTGAKRRSVQLWAERGVIRALKSTESAGTGVHRQFDRNEAIIACVIHPFAMRQISLGELANIATAVRSKLLTGLLPTTDRVHIEAAIRGKGDTILSYEGPFEKDGQSFQVAIHQGGKMHFASRRAPGAIFMAIRLETYLQKIQ